jgi:hypothetical protein
MRTLQNRGLSAIGLTFAGLVSSAAHGGYFFVFSDPSGLSATAEFTLVNPTTLVVCVKNTSTGVPGGFSNSDQILTGISWDFGSPGFNGDVMITGGSVATGPTSFSVNFDITNVGSNADVSGEYGYGNMDGTGALTNFVSTNTALATPFGGANLDATVNIDGPQAGLISSAFSLPLGGLGAIQDEICATLTLSFAYTDAQLLADLENNGVRVEFGSDAAFIFIPAPGALALLAAGAFFGLARRRRHA